MTPPKNLQERQKELQSLLATAAGRVALEDLASRYAAANDQLRRRGTSVITYILVYEREHGLLSG